MWTAIIGVIGTLFGVAVGGGISILKDQAQFRREKDWQQKQLVRDKLEEICQILEQIKIYYRNRCVEAKAFMEYCQHMNIDIDEPYNRLSMLISFYAPELAEYLVLLSECKLLLIGELRGTFKVVESKEESPQSIIDSLTKIFTTILKVTSAMEIMCAVLARKCI